MWSLWKNTTRKGSGATASYLEFHCLPHKNTWKQVFINSHLTSAVVKTSTALNNNFFPPPNWIPVFFFFLCYFPEQSYLSFTSSHLKDRNQNSPLPFSIWRSLVPSTRFICHCEKYYPCAMVKNRVLYFRASMKPSVRAGPRQCKATIQRGLNVPDKSFHFGQFPNINISARLLTWHKYSALFNSPLPVGCLEVYHSESVCRDCGKVT